MTFNLINFNTESGVRSIPELELYFSTNEGQLLHYYEPELGLFVAESPMVIERALAAGYEPRSFVMIDRLADEMCEKFKNIIEKKVRTDSEPEDDISVPVYTADYETIAGMTGVNITRGVLALMKRRQQPGLSDVISGCHRIAVFDDVENPTNIGAMFRSAAALGIEAVVLTDSSSDPLYRRASRVSVGTVFQVPWIKLGKKDSDVYIHSLHDMGFKTAAMALSDDSVNIDNPNIKKEEKLAVILGNEGFGLSDEVIGSSDYVVRIPMKHNVDSLNVAAASSIVFWEIMKTGE
ncbi:MAG: RNA methyltransferase [Eubacterium sp.]|nr:RNA methyltransferase [Eubacterium sp.]